MCLALVRELTLHPASEESHQQDPWQDFIRFQNTTVTKNSLPGREVHSFCKESNSKTIPPHI